MRAYYIDVRVSGGARQTAVLAIGPLRPTSADKQACVELVTRLVDEGWILAAHGATVIRRLAHRSAVASRGTFVELDQARSDAGSGPLDLPKMVFSPGSARARLGDGL